jgi:hypothetical protein
MNQSIILTANTRSASHPQTITIGAVQPPILTRRWIVLFLFSRLHLALSKLVSSFRDFIAFGYSVHWRSSASLLHLVCGVPYFRIERIESVLLGSFTR